MIEEKTRFRQRLEELFMDIHRLATNPEENKSQADREELETLRARLLALETQFEESNQSEIAKPEVSKTGRHMAATYSLYEHDQIGYAYREDRLELLNGSAISQPVDNPGGITIPLTAGDQTIGELQIEPSSKGSWSGDESELIAKIADQAALKVQNLRLISTTERARNDAELATRRFIHENWQNYLDAIHKNERIGYAYDQNEVIPLVDGLPADADVQAAVDVLGEQVGHLYLKSDPKRPLSADDHSLVDAVMRQVGQQVENIRLLAESARSRAEAEEAARRVTRENWQGYTERQEDTLGYIYDSNQVRPLNEMPIEASLSQPLIIRGEPIGQLAVAGMENATSEMTDLLSAIAAQASLHLETLRLNEELQRRARELQELDRLKSAFLANMSHELRTPLNSILGFADVILEGLDGPLTENMDNDLRLIQKNGQHLLHLINDVLDMAKIESGRMNLHPETFKVQDVLEEVISITSTLADEKETALFIEEESDRELEIFADNTRLRQVMINLVNNAIKFTEKGTIRLSARLLEGDRALITVKDSGIGIPPDKLESVFQEFTQVDTSTTRKAGGTGLGLPISRRLVEMHGGSLWAESSGVDGEGAMFLVELPLEAKITEAIEKKER